MPQIIPIRDLKNTSEISEMCHAVSEPIFVTKNGYGDMVVMSMEAFVELQFESEVYLKLQEAERRQNELLEVKQKELLTMRSDFEKRLVEIQEKLERGEEVEKLQYVKETYFDSTMDLDTIIQERVY